MRLLLYIVICSIGLVYSVPSFANKTQLPNKITLKLNEPAVSGQSLTLTTTLDSGIDFYQGFASLVISSQRPGADKPIEVYSGDGNAGFAYTTQVSLPPLMPGKYKVHGTFSIFANEQDTAPLRTGTNLYIEVRGDQVLSSNISFSQIKRLELKAQLGSDRQDLQSKDVSTLKTENPKLFQAIDAVNEVPSVQSVGVQSIVAKPRSVAVLKSSAAKLVQTVELSAGQIEAADPRKRLRQKAGQLDKANAVLETQEDEY